MGEVAEVPCEVRCITKERVTSTFFELEPTVFNTLLEREQPNLTFLPSPSHSMCELQDIRSFTVQIRHAITEEICGTGFVVCSTGKVVTCRHVVAHASEFGIVSNDVEVGIYFEPAEQAYHAVVVGCFPESDDDIVLLQLKDVSTFDMPEQMTVAKLSSPGRSQDHRFRCFGYRRLDKYLGAYAYGWILGSIPRPEGKRLLAEPLQIESPSVDQGMSGAAILDSVHDQVVGIVSETWHSTHVSTKDRDTAFAVDARVLALAPMNLPLQALPQPQSPESASISPSHSPQDSNPWRRERVSINIEHNLIPSPPPNWVGRAKLLSYLNRDWSDSGQLIVGLIGFGGEGKSSLASYWLSQLEQNSSSFPSDGIFWWSFYDKPTVEVFFESLLTFLIPAMDPHKLPSASVKAQVILSMLGSKRYLLVLDGLEVLQHQSGKNYGRFKNDELQNFLSDFAKTGEYQSFCLITSRAPLIDLINYSSYTQYDVAHLSPSEGRELLGKLGVRGTEAEIDDVVNNWGGYALALSLLGTLLAEHYEGDVKHIRKIVLVEPTQSPHEQIERILRRYDEHLLDIEKNFLVGLSAYRLPVPESALTSVFQVDRAVAEQLQKYSILRRNHQEQCYTLHPLIRDRYFNQLATKPVEAVRQLHRNIAEHYAKSAPRGDKPLLRDLLPWMEAVHHYCQAGMCDYAFELLRKWIYRGDRHLIIYELCAYKDVLNVMMDFFPDGDTSQNPQLSDLSDRRFILNEVGFCTMNVARLREAEPFYHEALALAISQENWSNASIASNNLAIMYAHLCEFDRAVAIGDEAVEYARRVSDRTERLRDERNALTRRAWSAHLHGKMNQATADFEEAERLHKQVDPEKPFLYTKSGIWYAEHLKRLGDTEYARRITEANLDICVNRGWIDDISRCHRVLGNLAEDANEQESARSHYNTALSKARGIGFREVLVEALLAQGLWLIRQGDIQPGQELLSEALDYAYESGALLYEIDLRLGLACGQLQQGNRESASREARRILQLAGEKQYFWGQKKAQMLLADSGNDNCSD